MVKCFVFGPVARFLISMTFRLGADLEIGLYLVILSYGFGVANSFRDSSEVNPFLSMVLEAWFFRTAFALFCL